MLSLRGRMVRLFLRAVVKPRLNARDPEPAQRQFLERINALLLPPHGLQSRTLNQDAVLAERVWAGPAAPDPQGALLYLHGGGYCLGSVASYRKLAGRLSAACGLPVLLPEYRRAPEYPWPAAVDDAERAYRLLLKLGHAPERIAVAGDSAGGGLTLALLLRLRERGLPQPAAAVCLSPWVDLTLQGATIGKLQQQDCVLDAAWLRRCAALYAGGHDPRGPELSPAFADLSGLPPLLIQVGSEEILLDDARRLEQAARGAGVAVRLEIWKNLWHVWHLFAGQVPEATAAVTGLARFLRQHTAGALPALEPASPAQ